MKYLVMFLAVIFLTACTYKTTGSKAQNSDVIRNVPVCKNGETKDCFRPLVKQECEKLEGEEQKELCRSFTK